MRLLVESLYISLIASISTPQTSKAASLSLSDAYWHQGTGLRQEKGSSNTLFFALGRVDRITPRNWKFH